jgi:acetyl-CoA C-acetyltransferase
MCSQTNLDIVTSLNFDPFYHRPFGLNWISAHAVQVQSYMNKWGVTAEQAAKVTMKNRSNAINNETAHLRTEVTLEEVMQSQYICEPLRELNIPPHSDGACALVLTTEEKAKKNNWPVLAWIKGVGWSNDTYYMGDKDLWKLSSLVDAGKRAYKMAGIKEPLKEIDVAELYDVTSFHELMEYEALGFCGEGEGGKFIDSGATFRDMELPVNPSGGMLSSNPFIAVGLYRVAEAALQVSGKAGARQVPNVKTALAQGMGGLCGQSNCVVILSN